MNRRFEISNLRFFILLLVASCQPYGGAVLVPEQKLRDIQGMDLTPAATTQASTQPTIHPATQPATLITITLEEVRQMALHNNLDLRVELLSSTISKTAISQEEAQFEALFVANANYSVTDQPSQTPNSQVSGSSVKSLNVRPGLQLPLRTGGTVNLDVPMSRQESNGAFSNLNPAYASDFAASISQPLLRGAGVETNTHRLRIAAWDYQISQSRTKLEVIRVLATADRAYWRLYAARQDLEVRTKEYDLAVAQLDRARRQVQQGAAAEVEIVRAESGVADRVEAIITAENALRDRQREMKRIINQPGVEMSTPTILVPGTLPRPVPYELNPDKLVRVAVDQRMEMLQLELQLLEQSSNVAFARNGLLPLVTLDYTYNVNGLGGTWDDSFSMLGDKDFEDHRVGLNIQIPIGNEAARASLRRALASRMQTLATKQQRELAIQQEVYNAVDQLEANWQRILATRQRTILNARVLDAEIRQFDLGLRTSTDVLDAQTNLANAQSAEIAAITEYQIAQVDLAFATGMLLGASGVSWEPTPAPRR